MSPMSVLRDSRIPGLEQIGRGKVRDIYAVDEERLVIVATDRLSAFDVVLREPIPGKGLALTALSEFWFARTGHTVANHSTDETLADVIPDPEVRGPLEGRASVVRRLVPLPIESIVRGYIIGSGWKDYQAAGQICGIALPADLRLAERLPEPIFTPSTKAPPGAHDENIDFAEACRLLGTDLAARVREVSLSLYDEAAAYARERGIIIADTKLEFAVGASGELVLIDEVLTPDSSRFWPADSYVPGQNPPSFDKQFVRDYLESIGWDKRSPAPALPVEVVERTAARYREAESRLTESPGS